MTDYIDRETVVKALDSLCDRVCPYTKIQRSAMCGACPLGDAFIVIEDDIPAADVVEVVRCEDCRNFEIGIEDGLVSYYACNITGEMVEPSGYCNYGERRGEEK